ncbi:hypothetical protein H5410_001852 [Solanum commersonii]|uniref:CCHC-type domain-containing protein n=1 Tax=Solanum commersonii TaxID=4109 RepID=A0A9J6B1A1_SOLCO|nr:hypothetical protein H5410_001852 [Solanum commersonii]
MTAKKTCNDSGKQKDSNVEMSFFQQMPTGPTPSSASAPTPKNRGFDSLADGEDVEFDVESGNDGRTMAFNVIGLDGTPIKGGPRYGGVGGGSRQYGGDGGYGGRGGRYSGGGNGRGGSECYKCGDDDHFSRKCSECGGYGNGGGGEYGGTTVEAKVVVTCLGKKGW